MFLSKTVSYKRLRKIFIYSVIYTVFSMLTVSSAFSASSAVFLIYHRFEEPDSPNTNTSKEQFIEHIKELKEGGYNVVSADEIISAFEQGKELPEKTVSITIDNAYKSAYDVAYPVLKEAGFPFTLFIAPHFINAGLEGYMSWENLKEMMDNGATLASQSNTRRNLAITSKEKVENEIIKSIESIEKETGKKPEFFAFPYGYASLEAIEIVKRQGIRAAFGQHSGAVSPETNRYYLPRFPFNDKFGNMERFRLAVNSLPLPVSDITPKNPLLSINPPLYGFTINDYPWSLSTLACYSSHEGKLHVEQLGSRIEVRMKTPFPEKASGRINCTLQRNTDNKWFWFGYQYFVPASE